MTIGDMPDISKMSHEIPVDLIEKGKEILRRVREEDAMVNIFPLVVETTLALTDTVPKLMADPEVMEVIGPVVEYALGKSIYAEITGIGEGSVCVQLTVKELPELFDYSIGPVGDDVFGIRTSLANVLELCESVLEEGTFYPVPDLFDFYFMGKMKIMSTEDLYFNDFLPLVGGMVLLMPKLEGIKERVGIKEGIFVKALRNVEM